MWDSPWPHRVVATLWGSSGTGLGHCACCRVPGGCGEGCPLSSCPRSLPSRPASAAQPRHLAAGLLTVITPNQFFKSLINSKSVSIFNPLNHSCFSFQGRDVVEGSPSLHCGGHTCPGDGWLQQRGLPPASRPRVALAERAATGMSRWGGHKPGAPQLPERGQGLAPPRPSPHLGAGLLPSPRKNRAGGAGQETAPPRLGSLSGQSAQAAQSFPLTSPLPSKGPAQASFPRAPPTTPLPAPEAEATHHTLERDAHPSRSWRPEDMPAGLIPGTEGPAGPGRLEGKPTG